MRLEYTNCRSRLDASLGKLLQLTAVEPSGFAGAFSDHTSRQSRAIEDCLYEITASLLDLFRLEDLTFESNRRPPESLRRQLSQELSALLDLVIANSPTMELVSQRAREISQLFGKYRGIERVSE